MVSWLWETGAVHHMKDSVYAFHEYASLMKRQTTYVNGLSIFKGHVLFAWVQSVHNCNIIKKSTSSTHPISLVPNLLERKLAARFHKGTTAQHSK